MKKKLLPMLLLVVIVFNFILCNSVVYADPGEAPTGIQRYGGNEKVDGEKIQDTMETGKDSQGQTFKDSNFGISLVGMVLQYVSSVINSFPAAIQRLVTVISLEEPTITIVDILKDPSTFFTIEKTVFNEVPLFNINAFNQESTYSVGVGTNIETFEQSSANLSIKETAAAWFYTCRLFAMMINLCILIYVGIRMALSTVASEEAKYKKMLMNWLESMVVLFLLHYIMLVIVSLGEIVQNILYSLRSELITAGEKSFEVTIMEKIYLAFNEKSGIQFVMYSLFFWFLTYIQLKFFLTYFKRLLSIMFLTVIGPFITVTYPIDKMGDGKAQAFEYWFKEYMINVAVQPIHAAIYLIFVFTAGEIAKQAPFVAMVFLLTLGRVENIVRNIFGITQSISMKNIDSEMRGKGK